MIYGRNKLLEWFDNTASECAYISIYRKGKIESGNFVFSNKDKANQTKHDARAFLDSCLSVLGSGEFEIVANVAAQNTAKGRFETSFTISQSEAAAQNTSQPAQVAGLTQDDVNRLAEERFTQLMIKKELEDLKIKTKEQEKEIKDLTAQASKPMNDFISGIAPFLPSIVQGLFPGAVPAVSGIKPDEKLHDNAIQEAEVVTETADAEKAEKVIQNFVTSLAAKFPDTWLTILEKLTYTVINDPGKINMALKFL